MKASLFEGGGFAVGKDEGSKKANFVLTRNCTNAIIQLQTVLHPSYSLLGRERKYNDRI